MLFADHRRQRDPDDDAVHLETGVLECILDDIEGDWIDLGCHLDHFPFEIGQMSTLPCSSISA